MHLQFSIDPDQRFLHLISSVTFGQKLNEVFTADWIKEMKIEEIISYFIAENSTKASKTLNIQLRNTLSELNGRYKDRSRNLGDVKHVSFPCANIIVTDFYASKRQYPISRVPSLLTDASNF